MEVLQPIDHDSPLIYTAEEHLLTPEEQALEAKVPTVSSYFGQIKSWFVRYRYPLIVAVANMVVIGWTKFYIPKSTMDYAMKRWKYNDDDADDGNDDENSPKQDPEDAAAAELLDQHMKLVLMVVSATLLVMYSLDGYLCYKGARGLEAKVNEQNHEKNGLGLSSENDDADAQGTDRPSGRVPSSDEDDSNSSPPASPTGFGSNSKQDMNNPNQPDYVSISKSVDEAFGCPSESATATFLVSLLYALFAVAVWNATSSAGKMLEIQIQPLTNMSQTAMCAMQGPYMHDWKRDMNKDNEEYGLLSLQKLSNFTHLPQDVRNWIMAHKKEADNNLNPTPMEFNRTLPYLQTSDGTVVFDFVRKVTETKKWGPMTMMVPGLAILSSDNNNVTEYMADIGKSMFIYNSKVDLVGFPSDPPYTGWCGIFNLGDSAFVQDEAICSNSYGNVSQIKHFAPVADDKDNKGFGSGGGMMFGGDGDDNMFATNEKLYVASIKTFDRGDMDFKGNFESRETIINLVEYDIGTLEKKLVASRVSIRKGDESHNSYNPNHQTVNPWCKRGYRIGLGTSLPTLAAMAWYLYRLDVPSCALPACLALAMILKMVLMGGPWASLIMLGMACVCLWILVVKGDNNNNKSSTSSPSTSSLWKFVSKEMMVWALYSFVLGAFWCFSQGRSAMMMDFFFSRRWKDQLLVPTLIFATSLAISILLNHPIFQILAYGFASIALVSGLSVMGGIRFLIVPVILFILSMGCFRLGSLIQEYRLHVLVYGRRIGRCLRNCFCGRCCGGRPASLSVV